MHGCNNLSAASDSNSQRDINALRADLCEDFHPAAEDSVTLKTKLQSIKIMLKLNVLSSEDVQKSLGCLSKECRRVILTGWGKYYIY